MERYVPLPPLPARIGRLNELAYDLWWSWTPVAREVFRDLDYPLWRFTDHNPVLLLHLVDHARLEHAAQDEAFLRLYDEALAAFDRVRSGVGTWWEGQGHARGPLVWIARQFALHQSLPVQATALGVVSGEFVRQASDLGIPFVGVGLMYPRVYRHQRLTADGWQHESAEYLDPSDAPITPAICPDGSPCEFTLPVAGRELRVGVWQVCAGRARILLLDTDVPANDAWDRDLSARDPLQDAEARLRQCVLLGAGAVHALEQMGIEPSAWHIAGPDPATVIIERLSREVANGASFADASARVRRTTFFSNRVDAPSPADGCRFAAMDRHVAGTWPALVPYRAPLLAMGRIDTEGDETYNASVFAARGSAAVSIASEGIHLASWIAADVARLLETAGWDGEHQVDLDAVGDEELWAVRQRLRRYLVDFMRERARLRWAREQASGGRLVALGTLLDGAAFTIGCAPRFGQGGDAEALFGDMDRLARIVTAARHPVQIVFAGAVDAGDEAGKHRLQRTIRHAMDPIFGGRIAFLEDYDLHAARLLVQGCDLWMTLPPAHGGPSLGAIKAAVNGVPYLGPARARYADATPEGWIAEDPRAIHAAIETLVPSFYERNRRDIPERWLQQVRRTLAGAVPACSARAAVIALASSSSLSVP